MNRAAIEALVRAALRREVGMELPPGGQEPVLLPPSRMRGAHDPAAQQALIDATPARIAVGRCGTRYTTATLLRFRADHAAARDAVMSEVDGKLLERLGVLVLRSQARDRRSFLLRPDAGRALSEEARVALAQLPQRPQLQIVYGDGLSATAINTHLEALHGALMRELHARGIRTNPPVFVHLSRVKIMDEVAQQLGAEACLFVCGERPGLGFADSLSAYYIYRPHGGATDADREVISNINPRGLPPDRAAQAIAEAIARILRERKSGVVAG
ncbi:MAG: ethanolamine ammonia-lyase subunit EutC [Myxococcota bacterium]|nr:ethanolamine ammonia-lyase subunit EutC [Myxococcota bacterium]